MKRMWINQPSTLQPLHHLNGTNVLVDEKDVSPSGESVTIYFITGDVIKQYAPKLSLSKGWIK
jgi:hypothetical protein